MHPLVDIHRLGWHFWRVSKLLGSSLTVVPTWHWNTIDVDLLNEFHSCQGCLNLCCSNILPFPAGNREQESLLMCNGWFQHNSSTTPQCTHPPTPPTTQPLLLCLFIQAYGLLPHEERLATSADKSVAQRLES